jgi:hypothetical protein
MDAISPLVEVVRYGNVRQTNTETVAHVIRGFAGRICAGLPAACGSMNDDAASEMFRKIISVNTSMNTLAEKEFLDEWRETLKRLADLFSINGILSGISCRILLDSGSMGSEDVSIRLSLALSPGGDPAHSASWIEGFLHGSGLILLHDDNLWKIIDDWVSSIDEGVFIQVLPLLRRTFSEFHTGERKQIGNRVMQDKTATKTLSSFTKNDFDTAKAEAILPVIAAILGLDSKKEGRNECLRKQD